MLFAATECIGQAKWSLFQNRPQTLIDFNTIDEGSRGPVGALKLAFRMKGRAVLASIGALVFVASLAVDPFIQQVLSYPSRSVNTTTYAPPTLPSVTTWNAPGKATMFMSSQADPCKSASHPGSNTLLLGLELRQASVGLTSIYESSNL